MPQPSRSMLSLQDQKEQDSLHVRKVQSCSTLRSSLASDQALPHCGSPLSLRGRWQCTNALPPFPTHTHCSPFAFPHVPSPRTSPHSGAAVQCTERRSLQLDKGQHRHPCEANRLGTGHGSPVLTRRASAAAPPMGPAKKTQQTPPWLQPWSSQGAGTPPGLGWRPPGASRRGRCQTQTPQ